MPAKIGRIGAIGAVAALVAGLVFPSAAIADPQETPKLTTIVAFDTFAAFAAANHVRTTDGFDALPVGTDLGTPALSGHVSIGHTSATGFRAIGGIVYDPVTPPNVLAPFLADDTLASGDLKLTFRNGHHAAGFFLVIPNGSNEDTRWSSTVSVTDAKGRTMTTAVTFQGVVGEQRFVGFRSHYQIRTITITPATRPYAATVPALDGLSTD